MKYRESGKTDYIIRQSYSEKLDNAYIHIATANIEADSIYSFVLGYGAEWSESCLFDLNRSSYQIYILNGLKPNDPKIKELIANIKTHMTLSEPSVRILIDLNNLNGEIELLNKTYYDMLSPLLVGFLYQVRINVS